MLVSVPVDLPNVRFSWRTFFKFTGPAWLMSLAYLDPGNLEADLQAGAYVGYKLIWVLFLTHCLGFVLQMLAVKLSLVSGFSLAEACRAYYPPFLSKTLWVMSEIAIIGADIQEVVGTSIALHVIFGLPFWAGTLITGLDSITIMAVHHFKGSRVIELFIFISVLVMLSCFVANSFAVSIPFKQVLYGFVPQSIPQYAILQTVAIIGAVIMPHNLYLHSALVKSRNVDSSSAVSVRQAIKYFGIDSFIAIFTSFITNIALLCAFSQGFFSSKCSPQGHACRQQLSNELPLSNMITCESESIKSGGFCLPIVLENASGSLENLMGKSGKYIFAVGLLAAGQASTLTGTFAGQYVMEGFLNLKIPIWMRIILTRSIALGPALIVAILRETIPGMADINEWLNVLQSLQLPFALLPLLYFSMSEKTMKDFKMKFSTTLLIWFSSGILICINFFLVFSRVLLLKPAVYVIIILSVVGLAYLFICVVCIDQRILNMNNCTRQKKTLKTVEGS